jgi:hypothetical protein
VLGRGQRQLVTGLGGVRIILVLCYGLVLGRKQMQLVTRGSVWY